MVTLRVGRHIQFLSQVGKGGIHTCINWSTHFKINHYTSDMVAKGTSYLHSLLSTRMQIPKIPHWNRPYQTYTSSIFYSLGLGNSDELKRSTKTLFDDVYDTLLNSQLHTYTHKHTMSGFSRDGRSTRDYYQMMINEGAKIGTIMTSHHKGFVIYHRMEFLAYKPFHIVGYLRNCALATACFLLQQNFRTWTKFLLYNTILTKNIIMIMHKFDEKQINLTGLLTKARNTKDTYY